MYVVTVSFRVKAEYAEPFAQAVIRQAQTSLAKENLCHQFDVCVDPSHPNRFFLYEVYSDAAAFEAHLETVHFREFSSTVEDWVHTKEVQTWRRRQG